MGYFLQDNKIFVDYEYAFDYIKLDKREIKKTLLKKELLSPHIYFVVGGSKKDLNKILKEQDIKHIIETKKLDIYTRYKYSNKVRYLILEIYLGEKYREIQEKINISMETTFLEE